MSNTMKSTTRSCSSPVFFLVCVIFASSCVLLASGRDLPGAAEDPSLQWFNNYYNNGGGGGGDLDGGAMPLRAVPQKRKFGASDPRSLFAAIYG